MKVLLVNGGPHREGCTFTALSEVAATLNAEGVETEIIWLGNQPVAGCIACGSCAATGRCFRSDCVNEFIEKAAAADGFVFGSPVHYAGPTGAVTSFMDRAFYAGNNARVFANKPAAAVVSCRRAGNTATFDQLNKYFTISCMPVVSSQYWNMIHGNTPEQARQALEGLQTMRTLGRNMAWMLRCIEAGRRAGIEPPVREEPVRTNFIR